MGLFDLTLADSPQYCAKQELARVVSECDCWRQLTDTDSAAEALTKIHTSPHDGPWQAGNFTKDELESRFCEMQIWGPPELTEQLAETGNLLAELYRNGVFVLRVRRLIRESEAAQPQRLYDYLLAAADILGQQIGSTANADQAPRLNAITFTNPVYASFESAVAQGDYAHWYYRVDWGDPVED